MAKTPSGSDMIRAALDAGVAKPTDIIAWVKAKYRKTVKKSLINNVKQRHKAAGATSAKKAGKRSAKPSKPLVAPSVAQSTEAGKSQSELIREALRAGIVKPAAIMAWVKETHGAEVSPSLVSQVKHKWSAPKRAAKASKPKAKAAAAAKAAPKAAPKAAAPSRASIVEDIVAVKALLERHSKENLNKLIEVL